ncbi:MAG: ECF-type sigma factor [Rhodocyclaceae bacterium]|jgi:RNA polymerase sigma factor (TIGR02999 family)|nr:ECF-type sigma factor [Xanthomonadaceae bacterium]MDX9701173.1 ECF-type sigma factor [Rhodocyclaceae bacterium]
MSSHDTIRHAEPMGDNAGLNNLFETTYERLKRLAHRQLLSGPNATLDATALVHELYLRIGPSEGLEFEHAAQFFAYAAQAMRHLLCDRARARKSQRAGGDWIRVTLTASDDRLVLESAEHILALDRALQRLAEEDARAARVVELAYFCGLTLEQVARVLQVTRRTVDRDWQFARAFLRTEVPEG